MTAVNQSLSRSIAAAVLLVILATAIACTGDSGATSNSGETSSPGTHSTSTTATSLQTISTAEDEVLLAYTAFWKALPVAARLSEGPREELLRKHLVSPALGNVLASLASQAAFKKRLYGQNVPKPEVSALTPTTATVEDCQDSSKAGVQDLKTGEKLTVGQKRNPVGATLKLDATGAWKIATLAYPGGTC